jgi:hypothetical protein
MDVLFVIGCCSHGGTNLVSGAGHQVNRVPSGNIKPVPHFRENHDRDGPCGGFAGKWNVASQLILGSGGKYKTGCEQVLPVSSGTGKDGVTVAVFIGRSIILPVMLP